MTPEARQNRAWAFWQEAQAALDNMAATMQVLSRLASEDAPSAEIAHTDVRDIHRNTARFQEKFSLLVREQKRKAVR